MTIAGLVLCLTSECGPARASEMTAADATALLCPGRGSLAPLFQASAERWKVMPVVLVAMFRVETSCDPTKVNRRTQSYGAMGIKLDGSANVENLPPAELLRPEVNIELGARHLRRMVNLCGTLSGGLSCYHGNRRCAQHRGDRYVARVLGLVEWAKRQLQRLQEKRA